MRCADYVFRFLADTGVKDVFMVSGGGAMFLNDALGKEKRIRHICTHHEQGAAIAAEGYARINNGLAVVSVTTGPGGTNALTGVTGQWLDSIPVLYISGQVKMPTCLASCPELPLRQLGDQEINIIDIVRPVTKYAVLLDKAENVRYELEKAVYFALSGRRGPVWIDIPVNIQSAEIDPSCLRSFSAPEEKKFPDLQKIPGIIELLKGSKAPAVIAGHGIQLSDAGEVFEKTIRKLKIPVLSTFGAFDLLPTDDPLRIGAIGTIGTRGANIVLQNADFILSLGSRNNIRQISYNYENFAKNAKQFVSVDIDRAELEKPTFLPSVPVCADVKIFLTAFLAELPECLPDWTAWLSWCTEKKNAYDVVLPEYAESSEGVNPYWITRFITERLPENTLLACANATPSLTLFQGGVIKKGQKMFCNSGCAAMGFGFPASVGAAAAARNHETVVCFDGDGSLMMNLQELQTAKHCRFPIKLFLFSNNEYVSIRQTQDNFFEGRHTGCDHLSGVSFPDWEKVAAAFDLKYVRISSKAEAEKRIPEILEAEEFVFCELKLTPGYVFSPKLTSRKLPDGTLVSPSLEDMFPFLSQEEMKKNVYHGGRA